MTASFSLPRLLSLAFSLSLLSACGGGGGGGGGTDSGISGSTPPPVTSLTITGDEQANTGQAVGMVAQLPAGTYTSYQWQQLSGPSVTLLADKTAGVGFDAVDAGNYSFRFTATKSDGSSLSQDFSMAVGADSQPKAQLRLDRAVSESAQFSLRLNATGISSVSSWSFKQVSGPTATLERDSSQPLLLVTAPKVTNDAVMVFEGSVQTNAGTLTDRAYVVVQNKPDITSPYFCDGDGSSCATHYGLNNVYPYKSSSPYAAVLKKCVYNNQLTDSNLCTVNTLPPIGRDYSDPTVAQIMDRVLVSSDWMGERFQDFLTQLDGNNDFKKMLRATTAIVISNDVRPSFYWALTGAIYLDPDSLWLTPAERDMINEQPDYRSSFGSDLQFLMPWRYVKNNDYAFRSTDPEARQSRQFSELEADLGSLLYHELTHANDFMSQQKLSAGIDGNDSFANQALKDPIVSDQLATQYPLQSNEMRQLGQVSFYGATANATQKAYQPSDISGFFFPDGANDYYNFASTREDLAMLFEETMVKLRLGIDRDMAVTNLPSNPTSGNDYKVDRGQRNRIGASQLRPRALFAVQNILPEAYSAASGLLSTLTPQEMCQGEGWTDNLTPACASGAPLKASSIASASDTAPAYDPLPSMKRRSFMPPLPRH
ncbi:hypothetical protein PVT67_06495 [Gallaecimonas kandeliae]|uniref:PKD domain-containing protein n=1 Tax=Gallaecimonas kandeliae TaxID=3029055 RepID=UPI002647092F|nr:hypothetical protein [Gallaecimonas kandeliae]WKE66879.1 hypothetical protein PVT67_06495 [Gallaecimonas kandeliae]